MILKNCKVKWAKLTKVDTMSNKFTIDLYPQDPSTIEAIENEGLTLKHNEEGFFIRATRKEDMGPPVVVDINKAPCSGNVGNGSVVNVIVNPFDYDFKGKKGRSLGLEKVQVVTLKTYVGDEDFESVNSNGAEDFK